MSAVTIDEPLASSAKLAWTEAPRLCYRDANGRRPCVSYHRVWQYLRLLDIIRTIRTNTAFFLRTFEELAGAGHSARVLVSATADYSMLAHLKAGYDRVQQPLEATVVDRCATALLLNDWYARHCGMAVATEEADLLEYDTDRPFDLICTHNLLSRFDATSRKALIGHWFQLLRPGGVVVTTQRIRPHETDDFVRFTEDEARQLEVRVTAAAAANSEIDVDPAALAREVYDYAIAKRGYTIRSNREITELFEGEGFDVRLADDGAGYAERAHDRPFSTAGTDSYRMRLIARRL